MIILLIQYVTFISLTECSQILLIICNILQSFIQMNQNSILNMSSVESLQQPILSHNLQCFRKVDIIYFKCYKSFLNKNIVRAIYCIVKFVSSIVLLFLNDFLDLHENKQLVLWSAAIIPISIMQFICYCLMGNKAKQLNSFLSIAEKLNHCQFVNINVQNEKLPKSMSEAVNNQVYNFINPGEDQTITKQMTLITMQIKYQCQKLSKFIQILAWTSFILYQSVQFWGYKIYISNNISDSGLLHKYLIVIIIIGTYQYIELYVIFILGIVLIPFYGFYRLIKFLLYGISIFKHRKQFKSVKYNAAEVKGEHQCKICTFSYIPQDHIVTLPCNALHHFHKQCIQQWLKSSLTCPFCRKSYEVIKKSQITGLLQQ